ncbi:MAG: DUF937 domain-containing protein [Micropruina sp.]|nr:DUF937 domain-containing protein [Micropruina sp.]
MDAVEEILADLPLGQLAASLGTDEATAEQAVLQVLPALFGGLQANAGNIEGEVSPAQALTQHAGEPGVVDLAAIDTEDGAAIVQHIFANSPDQLQSLSGGGTSGLLDKLLPLLAPLVMAYIAKKLGMGSSSERSEPASGGGLGDLLGPILGGILGGGSNSGDSSGSGLGDLLGQILAGQAPQQSAPSRNDQPQQPDSPFRTDTGGSAGR